MLITWLPDMEMMNLIRARYIVLGFLLASMAPAYAANVDALDISDWQNAANPFARSESLNGLSIATALEVDHQTGAHLNATWSCVKDGTDLAIGISNGDLDYSPKTDTLPVKVKIDNGSVAT